MTDTTRSLTPWTDKQLKAMCREFRKGMLARMSSEGRCAMVSWALQGFLSFALKLETQVYESDVGEWNHLWLKMPDGRVIDCTADQFNRGRRRYPQVYIGMPLDIHEGGKPYAVK
jgi:hypothetical protein